MNPKYKFTVRIPRRDGMRILVGTIKGANDLSAALFAAKEVIDHHDALTGRTSMTLSISKIRTQKANP